jgi:hypothetical protein
MRRIIDQFHAMQLDLKKPFPNVTVVPVPGTLNPNPANYTDLWENELHPRWKGFKMIGAKFAAELAKL